MKSDLGKKHWRLVEILEGESILAKKLLRFMYSLEAER